MRTSNLKDAIFREESDPQAWALNKARRKSSTPSRKSNRKMWVSRNVMVVTLLTRLERPQQTALCETLLLAGTRTLLATCSA